MKVAFVALVAVMMLGSAAAAAAKDPQFDGFMSYIRQHNKQYNDIEEFADRFENYKASVARIADRNTGGRNNFGLNKFSDMSQEEFKAAYLGFHPNPAAKRNAQVVRHHRKAAPSTFDWRNKGAVTPVKNQAQCGSCWAFSTAEEIESMWFLAGNPLTTLSEQQIVSCDTVDQGCSGGDTVTAYSYVQGAGGLESEDDYPYTSGGGDSGTCSFNAADLVANITGFTWATPNCNDSCDSQDESTLMTNLAATGPVSICVNAEPWQDYTSGIMQGTDCTHAYTDLDHCVQLVGYDYSDPSNAYWIVRNSWDTTWGNAGYIYLQYGVNTCGVADEATFATI